MLPPQSERMLHQGLRATTAAPPAWTTSEAQSWKCSLPFSSVLFDACKIPTPAEIQAEADRELAQIRAVNPELADQAHQAQIDAAAAYCRANPVECSNYTAVTDNPVLSGIMGPDLAKVGPALVTIAESTTQAIGSTTSFLATNWTSVLLLGAAGFAALLLMRR